MKTDYICRFLLLMTVTTILLLSSQPVDAASKGKKQKSDDVKHLELLLENGKLPDDPQLGVATYYANRFTGRPTSSGRPYQPDKFTAAHCDLPLGSIATVENLKNGKKVTVLINDRCRRRSFQLIDLSRSAAEEIGLIEMGITKVRIVPFETDMLLDDLLEDG
jgi:rare lipoprotein A